MRFSNTKFDKTKNEGFFLFYFFNVIAHTTELGIIRFEIEIDDCLGIIVRLMWLGYFEIVILFFKLAVR